MVHMRSLVVVAAVDSYAAEPQSVRAVHTRSDVVVGGVLWYWLELEHTVSAWQIESCVVASGLVTNAVEPHAVF